MKKGHPITREQDVPRHLDVLGEFVKESVFSHTESSSLRYVLFKHGNTSVYIKNIVCGNLVYTHGHVKIIAVRDRGLYFLSSNKLHIQNYIPDQISFVLRLSNCCH